MPLFSIITPVYDPPLDAFEQCVRSILGQTFTDWEWCLANDASPDSRVSERLRALQRADARIRVVDRAVNGGIVAASNGALAMARGEFLVLLDNDDELRTDALALVAVAVGSAADVDYVYSDEDKIDVHGTRFDAFHKPDWSPERLLAQNYTSHLSVLRRTLVNRVGRFRAGFDGSQDYDLVLRVTEQARRIVHVSQVLYHWRTLPTSTATAASAKPYAFRAAVRAVGEHLERGGIKADIDEVVSSVARIRRRLTHQPEVSIILPIDESRRTIFGAETSLAINALRSLVLRTSYANYRVLLVAPESVSDAFVESLMSRCSTRVTVVRAGTSYDRAYLINAGLVACDTQRAVLFDQRCEIVDADWLQVLLGYEHRNGVAMIAPMILDGEGSIVSAGLAVSPVVHDIGQNRRNGDPGIFGVLAMAHECIGVATHCALVDVAVLKAIGGLSCDYRTRYYDFDLARKLHDCGFHAIITPLARIRTHGSDPESVAEREHYESRWRWQQIDDPYTRVDTRFVIPIEAR
jgi:glycosyltransferase involved in cell wall biosynthesis